MRVKINARYAVWRNYNLALCINNYVFSSSTLFLHTPESNEPIGATLRFKLLFFLDRKSSNAEMNVSASLLLYFQSYFNCSDPDNTGTRFVLKGTVNSIFTYFSLLMYFALSAVFSTKFENSKCFSLCCVFCAIHKHNTLQNHLPVILESNLQTVCRLKLTL